MVAAWISVWCCYTRVWPRPTRHPRNTAIPTIRTFIESYPQSDILLSTAANIVSLVRVYPRVPGGVRHVGLTHQSYWEQLPSVTSSSANVGVTSATYHDRCQVLEDFQWEVNMYMVQRCAYYEASNWTSVHPWEFPRAFHGSGRTSRVGTGRVGSAKKHMYDLT